jgi:hypothetical protein
MSKRCIATKDDLRKVLAEVFSPADVDLIMASPVRPDLHTHKTQFYLDYLWYGGQAALREEIALAQAFVRSGIFALTVHFPQ